MSAAKKSKLSDNSDSDTVFRPNVEIAVDGQVTKVIFTLDSGFKLHDHYFMASRAGIQESLTLGAESYLRKENWIRGLSADEVCGAAVTAAAEEYREKTSKAAAEVEGLRRRMAELTESARADVEKAAREAEAHWAARVAAVEGRLAATIGQVEKNSEIMTEASLKHRRQVEMMEEQMRGVEADVRERVCRERDEMWRRVEEVGAARVADLERRLGAVEERRRELEEKLTARMVVAASSSLRGAAGEEDFGQLLSGVGLVAESTGKQSHMCDYKGVVDGVEVFYEVKNHESVLREEQITKFLRDMKEHPEVGVGVFVALKLPLPGRRRGRGIVVEWLEDRRLVVFCGELLSDGGGSSGLGTMELIKKFVEAGVRVRKMILDMEADGGGEAEVGRLMDRIKRGQSYLEMVSERARGLFNKMRIDAKTVEAIHESSLAQVKMMREEIKMTVGAFLGETLAFEEAVNEEKVPPVSPKVEADASGWENITTPPVGYQQGEEQGQVTFIQGTVTPAPRKRTAKPKNQNLTPAGTK